MENLIIISIHVIYLLFVLWVVFGYKAKGTKTKKIKVLPPDIRDHCPLTISEAVELADEINHHHFEIVNECLYQHYYTARSISIRPVRPMPNYEDNLNFKFSEYPSYKSL